MKKNVLIFCFLVLACIAKSQEVGISVNYPPNADINEEFKVEIAITKGDILGFARLQIDFPEALIITSNQTAGSNFTYKDGKARFLWMSLPADHVLNVVCVAKSTDGGLKQFEGSFSYVLNNETNRSSFPLKSITIGSGETVAEVHDTQAVSTSEAERLEAERRAREEAIARAEAERLERERVEAQRLEEERRTREENAARDEAERLETERKEREQALANQTMEVKNEAVIETEHTEEIVVVEINTSDEEQRIEEERRAREEAIAIAEQERRDADERARAELEAQQNIVVVDVNINNEDAQRIEAERKERELVDAQVRRQEEEKAARERADTERRAREESERRAREEATTRADAERISNERIANERRSTTTAAKNTTGVNYRVQIGASRRPADPSYYTRIERAIPEYTVVKNDGNDGWYRYTIGSLTSFNDAQTLLNRVKQLGHEAFITAFKDGKKITVEEAKRILGQ